MKLLKFVGSSLDDLKDMPKSVTSEFGLDLMRIQYGGEAADFKPMATIGPGVYEIRNRDESGAYRVIYVAKYVEAIYVLHAFKKTTQKTAKSDIELATARLKQIGK
ncbi:MAG: type II toxin-antitoxin system RelE/ParE family toxin [Dokdonella sp.]